MSVESSNDSPIETNETVKKILETNAKLEEEVAELQLQLKVRIFTF